MGYSPWGHAETDATEHRSTGSEALAGKFNQAEADHAVGHMCLLDEPETNPGDEHSGQMDIRSTGRQGCPCTWGWDVAPGSRF